MIVGAGPAGLAAAVYLQRAGVGPVVIERGTPGGLLRGANLVENYPGFPRGIRGEELASLFSSQLATVGGTVTKADAKLVTKDRHGFSIDTDIGTFGCEVAIIATGTRPKEPTVPGLKGLGGRNVFSEVTDLVGSGASTDRVVILGGGDAAFDYALNLRGMGVEAEIVSRSKPHCLPLLETRARARGVAIHADAKSISVARDGQGVRISFSEQGHEIELSADALITAFGRMPNIELVSPALRRRFAKVWAPPDTGVPGLFVCGDVARGSHRQAGIAVGDGIMAAMLAVELLSVKGARK